MLALEVYKLDSLSTQNAQELILQSQSCSCAPVLSALASPERDLCEVQWCQRGSTAWSVFHQSQEEWLWAFVEMHSSYQTW